MEREFQLKDCDKKQGLKQQHWSWSQIIRGQRSMLCWRVFFFPISSAPGGKLNHIKPLLYRIVCCWVSDPKSYDHHAATYHIFLSCFHLPTYRRWRSNVRQRGPKIPTGVRRKHKCSRLWVAFFWDMELLKIADNQNMNIDRFWWFWASQITREKTTKKIACLGI